MKVLGTRPADFPYWRQNGNLCRPDAGPCASPGFSATGQLAGSLRSIKGAPTRGQSPTAAVVEHFLEFIQSTLGVLDLVCLEFGFDLGHGYVDYEVERLSDLRRRRHHACRSDDGRDRNKHALDVL